MAENTAMDNAARGPIGDAVPAGPQEGAENSANAQKAAIDAARKAFLEAGVKKVTKESRRTPRAPRAVRRARVQSTKGPDDRPRDVSRERPATPSAAQARTQAARNPDIASRSAGGGRAFVDALTGHSAERGYGNWVQLDIDDLKAITDPQAREVSLQHLATNAREPAYARALQEIDPALAQAVSEVQESQMAQTAQGAVPQDRGQEEPGVLGPAGEHAVEPVSETTSPLSSLKQPDQDPALAPAAEQIHAAVPVVDAIVPESEPTPADAMNGVNDNPAYRLDAQALLKQAEELAAEQGVGISDDDWARIVEVANHAMLESRADATGVVGMRSASELKDTPERFAAVRLAGQMAQTSFESRDARANPFVDGSLREAFDDRINVLQVIDAAEHSPVRWPDGNDQDFAELRANHAAWHLAENPPHHGKAIESLRQAAALEKQQRDPNLELFGKASAALERYVADYARVYEPIQPEPVIDNPANVANVPYAANVANSQAEAPAVEENGIEAVAGVRIEAGIDPRIEAPAQLPRMGFTARVREAVGRVFTSAREAVDRTPSSQPKPESASEAGEMRAPAVMTKDGYAIPEAIAARYVVRDGNFWRFEGPDPAKQADHDPHFTDHGARLGTPSDDRQTIADMITVAQAKGWDEVAFKGSEPFRRNAWIEASLAGVKTRGFRPDEQDHAMLETARRERESLTIKAGTRARAVDTNPPVPHNIPVTPSVPGPLVTPVLSSAESPVTSAATAQEQAPAAATLTPTPTPTSPASLAEAAGGSGPQPASPTPSSPDAADDAKADTPAPGPQTFVSHGAAPYLHDETNSDSYFITTRDSAGKEKTVWGIDLPRALEASDAQIGEPITLTNLGKQWVKVEAPVKDAAGKVTGYEEKEVHRNTWEVRVGTPQVEPPLKTVGEFRKEVEGAIAGLPENVRRVVMDRFAERIAAGLEVQADVANTHATPQAREAALGPALDARLGEVDRARVARETPPVAVNEPTHEAPRHSAPKPKPAR